MRVVTQRVVKAWLAGKWLTLGNTRTDGKAIYLHGNCIARRMEDGQVQITTSGWNTLTTRERLNGVLQSLGLRYTGVFNRKGDLRYGTHDMHFPWDGEWMTVRV